MVLVLLSTASLLTSFAMDAGQRLCLILVGLTGRLAMAVHDSLTRR